MHIVHTMFKLVQAEETAGEQETSDDDLIDREAMDEDQLSALDKSNSIKKKSYGTTHKMRTGSRDFHAPQVSNMVKMGRSTQVWKNPETAFKKTDGMLIGDNAYHRSDTKEGEKKLPMPRNTTGGNGLNNTAMNP